MGKRIKFSWENRHLLKEGMLIFPDGYCEPCSDERLKDATGVVLLADEKSLYAEHYKPSWGITVIDSPKE